LMTAITLGAQGHRCRVYERIRQSHETGMGFILMPEGIDLLESFGVRLTGEASGVPLHYFRGRDEAGHILHEEAMPAGARSTRRRDLIAALMRALPENDILTFDAELEGFEFDGNDHVTAARLSSGATIQADLYVGADGHRSRARYALFPDWPAPEAQVMEVVGLVPCDTTIRWAGENFNKFHASGGGLALGIVPVTAQHVVWFLQFDAHPYPPPPDDVASAEIRREFVEKLIGRWADPIPRLLSLTAFSQVHVWRPVDTDPVPYFYRGNLVLAGDAAHPLHPFTSQGVSSALADAAALAQAVATNASANIDPESNLDNTLSRYSAERREQCAPYVAKARELTRQFVAPQVSNPVGLPIAQ